MKRKERSGPLDQEDRGLIVPVNYNAAGALAREIIAGNFDVVRVPPRLEEISLGGSGKVEHDVHLVHFGRDIYNHELPYESRRGRAFSNGLKFADPLTSVRFARCYPDRQRQYPLGILFVNKKGRLCFLCLGGNETRRSLVIRQTKVDRYWSHDVRFLTVRNLPKAARWRAAA